jgi:hypothetical protein
MVAFMPDPHILVRVVAGTESGRPAPMTAWGRRLLDAGHQTAAEHGFVHVPAQLAEAAEGATDGGAGQLRCAEGVEAALEGTDGGAAGGNDHDGIWHCVLLVYLLLGCLEWRGVV